MECTFSLLPSSPSSYEPLSNISKCSHSLHSRVVILNVHILFQNTEERKVGVYVRAHPTIELLEDRLYLGKRNPLVTMVETKVFNLAFSQKSSEFHQSKICRRENCNYFAKFRANSRNFAFFVQLGKVVSF
jgi:hypothetical protein